ncbi:hypothetical protein [Roseobacter weihaiensis]|uniref:hypothetical protein n=1 Tax=Roseobacter weihaiensis TaxID=2763262 RepID=UPI001D0ACCF7|nr:hypothetical protein [Roseobacter sp. H9]
MTEPVIRSEAEDVLASVRRFVGEQTHPVSFKEHATPMDRFVLTPKLRVPDQDVLRLMPEDAVPPAEHWHEFEEPPLSVPGGTKEPADTAREKDPQQAVPSHSVSVQAKATDLKHGDFSDLSAKIAALETAIAKTADQWEPDGDVQDAYAGTQSPAMKWRDDIELDATGKPLNQSDAPSASLVETAANDLAMEKARIGGGVDEDALRAIVAEIVRSELQGELGQRITRNVRKLVRREIHRALTAQSLE